MHSKKFLTIIVLLLFLFVTFNPICISESNEEKTYFRLKKINDTWCFINPDKKPFFSIGIGSISARSGYSPSLGFSRYNENIIDKYGSEEKWANITHDRLVKWGFNTVSSSGSYIKNTGFNYTINLNLAGDNWETGEIADYFSDEWVNFVDERCKQRITNVSNDTKLIGYFLDNEVKFSPDWRTLLDIFDCYMKFSSNSSGKIRLVNFLENRYKDIDSFNKAWRTNLDSFSEILHKNRLGIWPYTKKARIDHNDFLYIVSEQFFRICHNTIRKYDKNHLILGTRFQSFLTPKKTIEACTDYVDVISVNHYPPNPLVLPFYYILQKVLDLVKPTNYLKEYYEITGKPILITEFYFRALDSGLPNTDPYRFFMPVLFTQRQRAVCFELQTRPFISREYSLGYHWFGYCDQPKTGRYDGENSNNGLVNVNDEPYSILVNRMKKVNKITEDKARTLC